MLAITLMFLDVDPVHADGGCQWFTYSHGWDDGATDYGGWSAWHHATIESGRVAMPPTDDGVDHGWITLDDEDLLAEVGIDTGYNLYVMEFGAEPDNVSGLCHDLNYARLAQDVSMPSFTGADWMKSWGRTSSEPDSYHLYTADDRANWNEPSMEVDELVLAVTHGGHPCETDMYWDSVYIYGAACPADTYPDYGDWEGDPLYYPYKEEDYWTTYQTYSDTTWYGDAYEHYVVFQLRPGANVYPVATLDILEVGVNSFGYYIDTVINVWPDVVSTTFRYEGFQSVTVSPGQRVGPNCSLGVVARNPYLGVYHLLIYMEYQSHYYNPVPYFSFWPNQAFCLPTDMDGNPVGPGSGEVPSLLLEVCQACNVPATWSNFGLWIVWLECMLQNIFLCQQITWFNGIIDTLILSLSQAYEASNALMGRFNNLVGVNVMTLGRLNDMGPWLATPVDNSLSWLDSLLNNGVNYLTATWDDLASRLDNLGYIVMSFASGSQTVVYQDPGTNYWDVLVEFLRLQRGLVQLLMSLLAGMFNLITSILEIVSNLASLITMLVSGLLTGIFGAEGVQSADPFGAYLGVSELHCTQAGEFAVNGATQGKAACIIIMMLAFADGAIGGTALRFFVPVAVGLIAIVMAIFILSQSDRLLPS